MTPPSCYGVGCLLSPYPSWHAPSGPAQLCSFGWCVISAGHFPKKSSGRNLKIGLPLSPPPNHVLLPLIHNFTVSCIGWVQADEVCALCVPSFYMCPKSTCCSLVHRGLKVLLFDFLLPLGADIYLLLGFTLLSAHFLIALISCHIILSFLP